MHPRGPNPPQLTIDVVQMNPSHRKRYDLRCEPDGCWTVYDIYTDAAYHTITFAAFAKDEAFARCLAEYLNREYFKKHPLH